MQKSIFILSIGAILIFTTTSYAEQRENNIPQEVPSSAAASEPAQHTDLGPKRPQEPTSCSPATSGAQLRRFIEAAQRFANQWAEFQSQAKELKGVQADAKVDRDSLKKLSDQLDSLTNRVGQLNKNCLENASDIKSLQGEKMRLERQITDLTSNLEHLKKDLRTETRKRIAVWGKFETLLDEAIQFDKFGLGDRLLVDSPQKIKALRDQIPGWYAVEKLNEFQALARKGDQASKYRFLKTLTVFGDEMVGLGYDFSILGSRDLRGALSVHFINSGMRPAFRGVFPYKDDSNPSWDERKQREYIAPTPETATYQKYWDEVKDFKWVHNNDDETIAKHLNKTENPFHGKSLTPTGWIGLRK